MNDFFRYERKGGLMYKALVCCRAGMGSSMLLKIKADQVIKENSLPIQTEHGSLDSLIAFDGDLVITLDSLADELYNKVPYIVSISSVLDKEEMKEKFSSYINWAEAR